MRWGSRVDRPQYDLWRYSAATAAILGICSHMADGNLVRQSNVGEGSVVFGPSVYDLYPASVRERVNQDDWDNGRGVSQVCC